MKHKGKCRKCLLLKCHDFLELECCMFKVNLKDNIEKKMPIAGLLRLKSSAKN